MILQINRNQLSFAEKILWDCGITEPSEIDIESIAKIYGAQIVNRHLDGCDARLVKLGNSSIISVNSLSHRARKKFSIGHELGHLLLDSEKTGFICSKSDIKDQINSQASSEARANSFASQLLIPSYIFNPLFDARRKNLDSVIELAELFDVSISATAIKSVSQLQSPGVIANYSRSGRNWYFSNKLFPMDFYLLPSIHHEERSFDLLFNPGLGRIKSQSPANHWLSGPSIWNYQVQVEAIKIQADSMIILLHLV